MSNPTQREADATATLAPTIACARRVYRYWRCQGLSPQDARFMVGGFTFHRYA